MLAARQGQEGAGTAAVSREAAFSRDFLLGEPEPFVLYFANIVDYMLWRSPAIKRGWAEARRALRRWAEMERVFIREGWYNERPPEAAVMLGGVYDPKEDGWVYALLSDSPVRMPRRPRGMWLRTPQTVRSLEVANAATYIGLLRLLVKAVIVRL